MLGHAPSLLKRCRVFPIQSNGVAAVRRGWRRRATEARHFLHDLGVEAEMPEDLIRYEALVLDALRGVVRSVLQRVLKRGIPGDHHFFITFDTCAPGVGLSKRLKDQYPQEMTIVLQHQFLGLGCDRGPV